MKRMERTAIERQLNRLDAEGLIRQVQMDPEIEYLFRHVLMQEAAYGSLLKQDRRRLHLAVGEVLEREYAHHLDDLAPLLARHFDQAEDGVKAQRYFIRAAEAAARKNANAEAMAHYDRALQWAGKTDAPSEALTAIHLRYGRLLEISGRYTDALARYLEMEMQAEEQGDQPMLLAALMAHATVHAAPTVLTDPPHGAALAQRALALSRALGDRAAEAKALWLISLALRFTDRVAEARDYGEQAVDLARELGLNEQLAYALNDLFPVYMSTADFDKGHAALAEAVRLGRRLDNPQLLIDTLVNTAELDLFAGNLAEADATISEAVQLADRIQNRWGQSYSRWILGMLLAERGQVGAAIRTYRDTIQQGAQGGFAFSQIAMHGWLGVTYAELGASAVGMAMASSSIEFAETLRPEMKGLGYSALTMCQIQQGILDEAQASLALARQFASMIDMSSFSVGVASAELGLAQMRYGEVLAESTEAIAMLRTMGMHTFVLQGLLYQGYALLGLGRLDEASRVLAETAHASRRLGSRRVLWRALSAQAECEAQRGCVADAAALRAQAQVEVDFVASGLDSEELRETFLAHARRSVL
jgi:tetratricopeptide (TPR) repeat protein